VADHLTLRRRAEFAALELAIALVFGGVATALVLTELRPETRLLLLAGASPRDHRLRAAAVGWTLGAAGVLLTTIAVAIIAGVAAGFTSAGSVLGTITPSLLPMLLVPPALALGAGLAVRPPRSLGRVGRVPRDAAGSLS
jgi:hypothetical protein